MDFKKEHINTLKKLINNIDSQISELKLDRDTLASMLNKHLNNDEILAYKYGNNFTVIEVIKKSFTYKPEWRAIEIKNTLIKMIREGMVKTDSKNILHLVHSNLQALLKQGFIKRIEKNGRTYYIRAETENII